VLFLARFFIFSKKEEQRTVKQAKPLRRVVIKEEYVLLTGDHVSAVLLSQIEYWTKRSYDFDKFMTEEKERAVNEGKVIDAPLLHGWIHKTAEEFSCETMMSLSANTIRTRLRKLVESGWISERSNPEYKWDETKQYRFSAVQVANDLEKLGYHLDGWVVKEESSGLGKPRGCPTANFEFRSSKFMDGTERVANRSYENFGAIPEININKEIRDQHQQQQQYLGFGRSSSADEPELKNVVVESQAVEEIMNYTSAKGFEVSVDCARDFLVAAGSLERAKKAVDLAAESASSKVRRGEKIRSPAGMLFSALKFNAGARINAENLNSEKMKRLAEEEEKYRDLYVT